MTKRNRVGQRVLDSCARVLRRRQDAADLNARTVAKGVNPAVVAVPVRTHFANSLAQAREPIQPPPGWQATMPQSPLMRVHAEHRDDQKHQQRADADHYAGDGQAVALLASLLDLIQR